MEISVKMNKEQLLMEIKCALTPADKKSLNNARTKMGLTSVDRRTGRMVLAHIMMEASQFIADQNTRILMKKYVKKYMSGGQPTTNEEILAIDILRDITQ